MTAQGMANQLDNENRALRSSLKELCRLGKILGRSPAMQEVYELILKAAATEAATPETVRKYSDMGFDVTVEAPAGEGISISDDDYKYQVQESIPIWKGFFLNPILF